ncbi:unnamed protein product [Ectocarpus fasciculatus]
MPSGQEDQLTFLDDTLILAISCVGLLCVTAAVLWLVRQSPDWQRVDRQPAAGEQDGDAGLLGGRTRVVPGGREATKAARKEAKKRAKAEFGKSSAGQKRQVKSMRSAQQQQQQPRSHADRERTKEEERKERSAEALRRLKSYILDHKVSSLEDLEVELSLPSEDIVAKIEELEARGDFTGILVDDARGSSSGGSFVRVGEGEMRALAAFINERGRLTLAEVAAKANRVLHLSESREEETRRVGLGERHFDEGSEGVGDELGGSDGEAQRHATEACKAPDEALES